MPEKLLSQFSRVKAYGNRFFAGTELQDFRAAAENWGYSSVDALTPNDMVEDLKRSASCGGMLQIVEEGGKSRLVGGSFCNAPSVCQICATRAGLRRFATYMPAIKKKVMERRKWAYHVVFTLPASNSLQEQFTLLHESLLRLRKSRRSEWHNKVNAGALKFDIKRGANSGLWHFHAHALVFCDSILDYSITGAFTDYDGSLVPTSRWSRDWTKATGGIGVNCHVRPLSGSLEKAVQEVTDYVTVLDQDSPESLEDWVCVRQATFNRRLWRTYGEFYDRELEEEPEALDPEQKFLLEYFFKDENVTNSKRFNGYEKRDGQKKYIPKRKGDPFLTAQARILAWARRVRSAIREAPGADAVRVLVLPLVETGSRERRVSYYPRAGPKGPLCLSAWMDSVTQTAREGIRELRWMQKAALDKPDKDDFFIPERIDFLLGIELPFPFSK